MNTRFRLHEQAFTRMKLLRMPLSALELLMQQGAARRAASGWEVAPADADLCRRLGRFASLRLLVSDDGRVLDIQPVPAATVC